MNLAQMNKWLDTPCLKTGYPARRKIKNALKMATEAEIIVAAKQANLILMKTHTSYILYPTNTFVILAGP